MTKYFTNNFSIINLYKKPSINSEIVTQIIYGESFSVSQNSRKWFKIKIKKEKIVSKIFSHLNLFYL